MKKLILFGLAGLLVLIIAGVLIAFSMVNGIAKKAIESGGTYALGAQTKVSSVSIGLLSGKVSMSGLDVANPAGGFQSPHFLSLGKGGVAVSLGSLRQPTVELPQLSLSNLDVNLEKRNGQTNFGAILDSLKQKTGGGDKPKSAPAGDEKKFVIRDLDIQNVTVHVDLVGGPGAVSELTKVTVPIERIKLHDVGSAGSGVAGSGVTMSELAGIIVKAVLSAAAENGGGVIPADMLGDLKGKLAALGDLDKLKMDVTASAKGKVDELTKKATDEAKKKMDEAADKLKGLIPGGDKGKK
jgi:uncharacterized protein involved in outer membrane biogenesis